MGTYSMDYTNVKESLGMEPLPVGEYEVKIDKIEETETKSSGRTMIKINYKVMKPAEFADRIIFDNIVLIEAGAPGAGMTKHFLHVIDEPYQDSFVVDPEHWIGKELKVGVTMTDDKKYNQVKTREALDIPF